MVAACRSPRIYIVPETFGDEKTQCSSCYSPRALSHLSSRKEHRAKPETLHARSPAEGSVSLCVWVSSLSPGWLFCPAVCPSLALCPSLAAISSSAKGQERGPPALAENSTSLIYASSLLPSGPVCEQRLCPLRVPCPVSGQSATHSAMSPVLQVGFFSPSIRNTSAIGVFNCCRGR